MKAADKRARQIANRIKNDTCWDVSLTPDQRGCIVFTPDLRWRAEEMMQYDSNGRATGHYLWEIYCDDDRRDKAQTCGGALLRIKEIYNQGDPK